MTAESVEHEALRRRRYADVLQARADRADRDARHWAKGSAGEKRLPDLFTPLVERGYFPLYDRALPDCDANIDGLLIGPAGVIVVDVKNWDGDVEVSGRDLRQNGRRRNHDVESVRHQAVVIAGILERLGNDRPPVHPVICFVGSARIGSRTGLERVHLLDTPDLCEFVLGLPARTAPDRLGDILAALGRHLPPRLSTEETFRELPSPSEPIVFLKAWRRKGHHRLYATDGNGEELGHLDLLSGEVTGSDATSEQLLARILPHYLGADNEVELSPAAQGVFRRFLDKLLRRPTRPEEQVLLVAYHWRRYGKNRLYLSRLDPGGVKLELGWFDLDARRSSNTDAEPLLGYCGHRYLAARQ
jgi:hypothetical protein